MGVVLITMCLHTRWHSAAAPDVPTDRASERLSACVLLIMVKNAAKAHACTQMQGESD